MALGIVRLRDPSLQIEPCATFCGFSTINGKRDVMRTMLQRYLFTMLWLLPATGNADVITLRADTWCPYTCDPKSPKPGFMIELAKQSLEPAGHTIDYKTLNWARAIKETRIGKYSAIVGAAKSDAPDFVFPGEANGSQNMCFFTLADNKWRYQSVKSLENILLGAINEYSYGDDIDAYIKKNGTNPKLLDLIGSENPMALNVKKLLNKRIGAFVDDRDATSTFLKTQGDSAQKIQLAGCATSSDLFIALSPKNPKSEELAKLIQDKIAAMRKDGTLKKLLNSYGVEDWKK
jgi:polar amino acid transport system substrate-binding protein